jgi:hypothetical protein
VVDDVVPGVDDELLVLVVLVLQGVPMVKAVSGLVTDVVTDVRGLGAGSATSGLVTGSKLVVVGRPIIGLTPRLPISSDPSGMPTRVAVVAVGDVAVMPEDVLDVVGQLPNTVDSVDVATELPVVDVVPLTPPPSKPDKVEVNAVIADVDVGAVEQPAPPVGLNADSAPDIVGEVEIVVLKPPGLSSTEPRGMPVGPSVGATVVRGDVAPIAGDVAVLTCAKLGPLGNSADIIVAIKRAVILGLWSFRMDFTAVLGLSKCRLADDWPATL